MPLVPMRLLLDHAAANNYGLAAFNVNNMEQIQAIMEAAKETDSPVIIRAASRSRFVSEYTAPASVSRPDTTTPAYASRSPADTTPGRGGRGTSMASPGSACPGTASPQFGWSTGPVTTVG